MDGGRRNVVRALGIACGLAPLLRGNAAQAAVVPAVGAPLALPDLPLIEGGMFTAAAARDRVVAVYWWASWCPFCAEMSPHVETLWRTQRDRGLTVLGISIDKDVDAPRKYRARRGYTFPSAMYTRVIEPLLPKPKSVPATWVRDRKGILVMVENGQLFPEDVADIAKFL